MNRQLSKAELNRVAKTQGVRLMDVFILGPFLIYASSQLPEKQKATSALLLFFGVTTTLYNLRNLYRVRRGL